MFVSCVQPVIIRSALFCTVCILFNCVSEMIGDQIVLPYSSMGLVIILYVVMRVSLLLPQLVEVRALSILIVFLALFVAFVMCVLKVSFGSRCSPRSLVWVSVGMFVLSMVSVSCLLYSAGSGVYSVAVDLSGFSLRLFCVVQACIVSRYGFIFSLAVFMFLCVVCIVRSSAYMVIVVFCGGCGRSEVYMLKSIGDRTPPCGTPVLNVFCLERVFLYSVYPVLPRM